MLENKLPTLFIIIPNNKYDDKELIINENKTILPYDLYKLFINWSGNDISGIKNGKDIFKKIDNNRTCYENEVYEDYDCACGSFW